jgi:3-hydroxyisobutyrate dehydrogenase-like beta-hydroxyacid dehydrogenase
MTSIGVVGVGIMGSAVAERLVSAGFSVYGFSRGDASRRRLANVGGTLLVNAADVARRSDVVILCLPDGAVSRAVCLEEGGLAEGTTPGTVVLDTTTSSPDDAIATGRALAARGASYFDVGLSGTRADVAVGRALALVGGSLDGTPMATEALASFCAEIIALDTLGDGMRAKLVVNHVHGLNRLALAEGLVLAERMGLDLPDVVDILRASAASSRAIETWGARMAEGRHDEPLSRIKTGRKDADLIARLAWSHGSPTPAWDQFVRLLHEAIAGGLGDADNSAVIEVLRRRAGIGRLPAESRVSRPRQADLLE